MKEHRKEHGKEHHEKHKGHHHVHPEHPSHHSHMNAEDPGLKRSKGEEHGISYHAGAEKVKSGMHHAARSHTAAGNGYLKGDK